jgi:hypothetical protein
MTADADEFGTARQRGQSPARAQRKRRRGAGVRNRGKGCAWRTVWKISLFGEGTTPQDLGVSFAIRPVSLTMKLLLWLSAFNAVVDVRWLNQRIEQLNMSVLFTLNQFHSQEFSCFSCMRCLISSTRRTATMQHRAHADA